MRWKVEMTPIGKTDAQAVVVEAESWQKALQGARALRGESGPMSGFSIELLESGYRAVDPMARVVYLVRKAPNDAAVTTSLADAVSKKASTPVPAAKPATDDEATKVNAERPVPPPAEPGAPPAPAPAPAAPSEVAPAPVASQGPAQPTVPTAANTTKPLNQTIVFGSPGNAAVAPPAPVTEKLLPTEDPLAKASADENAATYVDRGSDDLASEEMPPTQVIYKREQDPSAAAPLTYREYVYAVASGTKEEAAERVLLAQLELIRKAIERARAGKFVNLAVFDVVFKGKPPAPPLATLSWKDWRGPPVLDFPRRRPEGAPKAAASNHPPAPAPTASVPAPAPEPAPPPARPPVSHGDPFAAATVPTAFPPPAAPLAPAPTPGPGPADRPSSTGRTRPSSPRGRAKGDELITELFEAMHDLHFLRDAIEGGDFCLALAIETIPSSAGLVHLYDIDRREFVVACIAGKGTERLLLQRHPESDPLLAKAMTRRRAVVLADASHSDEALIQRYEAIGGAKSVIIAPVMHGGRFIGAIEIINPVDGAPYTDAEGNALSYIAEQYAEFVAQRGIVVDAERISQRPSALRAR